MPLLRQVDSQSISTLTQASNIIRSITEKSDQEEVYFEWNRAEQLYQNQTTIDIRSLKSGINGKENLLLLFSHPYNSTYTARFGMYAHQGYTNPLSNPGGEIVQDN